MLFRPFHRHSPTERQIAFYLRDVNKLVKRVESFPPRPRIEGKGFVTFPRRPFYEEPPRRKDYGAILRRREFWMNLVASSLIATALSLSFAGIALFLINP
jgi:hypothetical protein